jgi:hypothetical protein
VAGSKGIMFATHGTVSFQEAPLYQDSSSTTTLLSFSTFMRSCIVGGMKTRHNLRAMPLTLFLNVKSLFSAFASSFIIVGTTHNPDDAF